ncbi:MAG: type II toxin-antitoxin system VapC family toxin [Gammaproteobacteria bacterium]|nr:type II toxin-antitoxin system VapC family toxin [Gammaproteobacteria bacterium]
MLVDTDVLIWNLRGNPKAAETLDANRGFSISAVSYMELVQGLRNQAELRVLRQALHFWQAQIIQVDAATSSRACYLVEQHALSSSLFLADALIGATAAERGETLLTGNAKHYQVIEGLSVTVFRP